MPSSQIYYPTFGSSIATRAYASVAYRYGFNGKEKDPESFNDAYDFGDRIYDSRLGRFLSLDPRMSEYSWQSPYAYYMNTPISVLDIKGKGGLYDLLASGEVTIDEILTSSLDNLSITPTVGQINNTKQESWTKTDANNVIQAQCDFEECRMCCLLSLANNLKALYPNVEKIPANSIDDAVGAVNSNTKFKIAPTGENDKTLTSDDSEKEIKNGNVNLSSTLMERIGTKEGIFIYAVGLAGDYHTCIVMVFHGDYNIDNGDGATVSAKNQFFFICMEDNKGTKVYTSNQLDNYAKKELIDGAEHYRDKDNGAKNVDISCYVLIK